MIWILGLRLTVITIIWGLNCLIKNVDVIVSSSSLHPSSTFEMYVARKVVMIFCLKRFVTICLVGCHPSISKLISSVWSFIILFTYKNNCCLIDGPCLLSNLLCGRVFNRWLKMVHGNCHID